MSDEKIKDIFDGLVSEGAISRSKLMGCSPEELAEIEVCFQCSLPKGYKDFLKIAGRGAGKLFQGTDIFYPKLLQLNEEAKELLLENYLPNALPDNAVVFCLHQGYEVNFFTPGLDDPPVYQYIEGDSAFTNPWKTFSEFLMAAIVNHKKQWADLN